MKVLQELPLVPRARQLRHTFVEGADGKRYKVLTFALYDFKVSPEFSTHETNVEEVNENGGRTVLVQPLIKRFFDEAEALAFHQDLVENFDKALRLKAPEKKEHAPAAAKKAEAAPAKKEEAPAEAKKPEPAPAKKEEPPADARKPEPPPANKDAPPAGEAPKKDEPPKPGA